MDPFVRRAIAKYASVYGLDPYAVESVSLAEAGGRRYARGDMMGGRYTSFGPFQLHEGGALPRGRDYKWAGSEAGIKYALSQMAPHAKGLKGKAAVDAIVRKFERPADPTSEIRRALSYYKKQGSLPVFSSGGSDPASKHVTPEAPAEAAVQQLDMRQALLGWVMANNMSKGTTSPLPFIQMASQMALRGSESPPKAPIDTQGAATLPYKAKTAPSSFSGNLAELFYDPLGGIKHSREIGAIGGHGDHVHIALDSPEAMRLAIKYAQSHGLSARENPLVDKVDPVHTKNSYHYRRFGKSNIGQALDVSGNPKAMADYYRWARRTFR